MGKKVRGLKDLNVGEEESGVKRKKEKSVAIQIRTSTKSRLALYVFQNNASAVDVCSEAVEQWLDRKEAEIIEKEKREAEAIKRRNKRLEEQKKKDQENEENNK